MAHSHGSGSGNQICAITVIKVPQKRQQKAINGQTSVLRSTCWCWCCWCHVVRAYKYCSRARRQPAVPCSQVVFLWHYVDEIEHSYLFKFGSLVWVDLVARSFLLKLQYPLICRTWLQYMYVFTLPTTLYTWSHRQAIGCTQTSSAKQKHEKNGEKRWSREHEMGLVVGVLHGIECSCAPCFSRFDGQLSYGWRSDMRTKLAHISRLEFTEFEPAAATWNKKSPAYFKLILVIRFVQDL